MSTEPTGEKGQHISTMQAYMQLVSFHLAKEEYAIEITKIKEIILVDKICNKKIF